MKSEPDKLHYRIDGADRIVEASSAWNAFASANDGAEAFAERILHRPLYDFIDGEETKMLIRALLQYARRSKQPLAVPFRCDAPDHTREMVMQLCGLPNQDVTITTHLVRTTPRSPVRILDRRAPRSNETLRICAWCNRVLIDNVWTEIDLAISQLGLFTGDTVPQLNHGICPDCAASVDAKLGKAG